MQRNNKKLQFSETFTVYFYILLNCGKQLLNIFLNSHCWDFLVIISKKKSYVKGQYTYSILKLKKNSYKLFTSLSSIIYNHYKILKISLPVLPSVGVAFSFIVVTTLLFGCANGMVLSLSKTLFPICAVFLECSVKNRDLGTSGGKD